MESAAGPSDSSTPVSSRPSRQRQTPLRFRDNSDDNDGTLCALCNSNEPSSLASSTVFWIDCNDCGCWVHNVCAFGKKNTVTRQCTFATIAQKSNFVLFFHFHFSLFILFFLEKPHFILTSLNSNF